MAWWRNVYVKEMSFWNKEATGVIQSVDADDAY